jgi:hypothetical protein
MEYVSGESLKGVGKFVNLSGLEYGNGVAQDELLAGLRGSEGLKSAWLRKIRKQSRWYIRGD